MYNQVQKSKQAKMDATPQEAGRLTPRNQGSLQMRIAQLQKTIGNRAVTQLLASSVQAAQTARKLSGSSAEHKAPVQTKVMQLVRGNVGKLSKTISLASLDELTAQIDAQIAQIDAVEIENYYIMMDDINQWRGELTDKRALLVQELTQTGGNDATVYPFDDIKSRSSALFRAFYTTIISIRDLKKALDDSYETHESVKESGKRVSDKEEAAKAKVYASKDKKSAKETPSSSSSTSESSSETGVVFPHKGKHQPPKEAVNEPAVLKRETTGGNPALYITNDPKLVIAWEAEAREHGFDDGFTVVYKFDNVIGADQGEMTQYIRIDGDHGHPIVESGSKTSFDSYIQRAIDRAETNADKLNEIKAFLDRMHISHTRYKGLS